MSESAWHVTEKANLKRILKNGLIPSIGPRSSQMCESGNPIEIWPKIFLFPSKADLENAMMNWLGEELEEEEVVYLEILIEGLEVEQSAEYELSTRETIKAFRIKSVFNEEWTLIEDEGPLENNEESEMCF